MPDRDHYPETCAAPCNECPWRREAQSGHLGPYSPLDWIKIAHSDQPIACHKTVIATDPLEGTGDWDHPKIRQCKGAAIFRANVGKNPRHPQITAGPANSEVCFKTNEEFLAHHGDDEPMRPEDLYTPSTHEGGKR